MITRTSLTGLFCLFMSFPTLAKESQQIFEAGLSAFRSGDTIAALSHWQVAASMGNENASFNLGLLYAKDEKWLPMRLDAMGLGNVLANDVSKLAAPNLSEAVQTYLQLKGIGRPKTFHRAAMRNAQVVMDILGNRPISEYSTLEAGKVRDALIGRGLAVLSVRRSFTTIKAIINLAIAEHGLNIRNPFSAIYMPEADSKKRVSIPVETIRQIQQSCMEHDDDMRWLVALISDTGMRLAEAAGLHMDDLKLDEDIPCVEIKPHPWRSLKTKGSQRQVPLVGASLWAAQRIRANASSCFAFPRYTDSERCNANSASNALNKWIQANFRDDIVIHGFRHAMRDRLRAVSCPSEMIDQIGGWSSGKLGEGYGDGFDLKATSKAIYPITCDTLKGECELNYP